MRPRMALFLVALTFSLAGTWAQAAQPPAAPDDLAQLVNELKGEAEPPKRSEAELQAAYAKVFQALAPKFGADNLDGRQDAQRAWNAICWRSSRPGAEAERLAASKLIAAALSPDLAKPALLYLLEELEFMGCDEAVDAIAPLLDSKDAEPPFTRERARRALQANPSPKALGVLRAALAKADSPDWRVALINALGARKDTAAIPALLKLAADQDQGVRTAAVEALARIGDKAAASAIAAATKGATPRAWRAAVVSYLVLAEGLVEQNDRAAALELYRNLLDAEDYVKCGAVIGVGRAGGKAELPVLFNALADPDPQVRAAAADALDLLPLDAVRAAAAEKARTATPELKVLLLQVLANRGGKAVLPSFVEAAADPDEGVRIAAYEGISSIGDETSVPLLVAALARTKGKELDAVRAALTRIPGKAATEAAVKALAGADPALRVEIIRVLAARKDETATPALLAAAEDKDPKTQAEALKAIGTYADEKALPPLVALLAKTTDDQGHQAAEKALAAIAGRLDDKEKRAEPLLAALPKADTPARAALLRVLGRLGGKAALEALRTAVRDQNAEIKDAAIRAMADWPDGAAAPDLLEIARTDQDLAHHVLALRGALRVLALPGERPTEETLKLYAEALKAARRVDEKKEALGGIGGVGSLAALKLVEPFLADEALKAEAAVASVKIAAALTGAQPDEAKAALKKLLEIAPTDDVKKQAQEALSQLDKFEDYITAWEVSGPYTAKGKDGPGLHDVAFPPENQVVGGTSPSRDEKVVWEIIAPGGGEKQFYPFYADLNKRYSAKENAAAYLRTNVWSPEDQKALLEFGSDDGAKVWLDGKLVINAGAPRSFEVGKDKVEVTLKKGWNPILVKVWNGSGHWGAAARFRKPDGSQLPGLRASLKPE